MERLGLEFISVFDMPPLDFVHLAADLGCRYISTGLGPAGYNPHQYPSFSLRDDAALRRDMIAVMRARGVSVSLGEGVILRPGRDARSYADDIALLAELGAARINTLTLESDLARAFDEFALVAELSAAQGMESSIEFVHGLPVGDLGAALAAVRHVGRPDFKLLIDTFHFTRSGARPEDLAALDPDLIGYVQLSDAPLAPRFSGHLEEARYDRMAPGDGELPLLEILAAMPRDRVVGVEVPLRALAEAGMGPEQRLRPCIEKARALLAKLDAL